MDLLLVEDKDSFRRLLSQALEGSAWTVCAVADPQEALKALEGRPFHVLVTDLRLPGMSGLELIRRARRFRPGLRVVLMSAYGEPKDIVEAMRLGADDFLPKPFDLDVFLAMLDRLRALVGAPPPDPTEPWIVHSPAMRALDVALGKAAGTRWPVLLQGERGAGRARTARRLHVLRHPGEPFLRLPAATLGPEGPELQMLRMLQGGTLYLAGLEHLAAEAVLPLLRAMNSEPGEAVDWMAGVDAGSELVEPLKQQIGTLELVVPPLRARREDILALAHLVIERSARQEGRPAPWLDRAAERQLLEHRWPGNVWELEMLVSRAMLFQTGHAIQGFPDLGLVDRAPLCLVWPEPATLDAMLKVASRSTEGHLLRRALSEHKGDLLRMAEALGISLRVLGQRLREQGIPLEDRGPIPPRKAP